MTAGGSNHRPRGPPLLLSHDVTLPSPSQKPGISPSSHQENKAMSIATASDPEIAPARPLLMPAISAVACVALADWLFYGWPIGISLVLFLGVVGIVAVASHRVSVPRNIQIVMAAMFVAGLLALIEEVNNLSVIVGLLAIALFVIVMTAHEPSSWQRNLFDAAMIPFRGPFQLVGDLFGALRHMKTWTPGWLGSLVAWIVPLSAFAIFLSLFASANPLIEHRLMQIDLSALFDLLDPLRIWFWALVACAVWPLLRRSIRRRSAPELEPVATIAADHLDLDYLLGVQAVTRSLILFNALFALQSGLDLTYLWGGANLPDGMSHAEYAHRGAYPLIATALLAAGFVLIAMRPGGPAEHSRLIRPLVLVWTGQNVLLVISSIFRLDLYVAAYSLTYLRLAAFIWMVLVAMGLVLMLIQIELRKPNSWLIAANAMSLALVLYGCCFINAPRLIASYNVEHCREAGGTGPNLDLPYLASLGPQALPSVEAYVKKVPVLWSIAWDFRHIYETRLRPGNWRAWSFRTWRLQRYLANNPSISSNLSDSDKG
jgi:Ca2+/Na+ antiporter